MENTTLTKRPGPAPKYTEPVIVMFPPAAKRQLAAIADAKGLSMSSLIRECVFANLGDFGEQLG